MDDKTALVANLRTKTEVKNAVFTLVLNGIDCRIVEGDSVTSKRYNDAPHKEWTVFVREEDRTAAAVILMRGPA